MQTALGVLIVDDEKFVREGLRYLIDWEQAGYTIIGEAEDGNDALEKIRLLWPDLVLLDVRMPGMDGTEVMQKAREIGFSGQFIILSGFSDFDYARAAIQYGAADYIVKPVDEMQLLKVVTRVAGKIRESRNSEKMMHQVMGKARNTVLSDLLEGRSLDPDVNYDDYGLNYPVYQVAIYESFIPNTKIVDFAKLLTLSSDSKGAVESIELNQKNVILIKGYPAQEHFEAWLRHSQSSFEKNSLIDSIYLVYGETVNRPEEISVSYRECTRLAERRFFCTQEQHVLSYADLPPNDAPSVIEEGFSEKYAQALTASVYTFHRTETAELLNTLRDYFYSRNVEVLQVQHFMVDLLLQIKSRVHQRFGNSDRDIGFDSNTTMIETIENAAHFNDIIQYFMEQFERVMSHFRTSSSDSVLDDILRYISENYAKKLTLESIGPLFGYNSSYLGKIFTAKTGMSFNAYRDRIRIEKSREMLVQTSLKIYEIADRIGYRNVDVYNQKFKKQEGISPSDYRKKYREGGTRSEEKGDPEAGGGTASKDDAG